jgi:hypothetical protein
MTGIEGVHLRAHPPPGGAPLGVAVPGDSIQAKTRFSKIFWGWQKEDGKGGYLNEQ